MCPPGHRFSVGRQFAGFPSIFLFAIPDVGAARLRGHIEIVAYRFGNVLDKAPLLFDCPSFICSTDDERHLFMPLESRLPHRYFSGFGFLWPWNSEALMF